MEVVAEGVETFEQVVHLRELGIRAAQGFVFAPPLPTQAFLQLVDIIDPIKAGAEVIGENLAQAVDELCAAETEEETPSTAAKSD